MSTTDWPRLLAGVDTLQRRGRVAEAFGTVIRARGIDAHIGQQCDVIDRATGLSVPAEVVGISEDCTILTPLARLHGLSASSEVVVRREPVAVPYGPSLLGRVIDAHAQPLDGRPLVCEPGMQGDVFADAPNPLTRMGVSEPFCTGVRALDGLLTVGVGQRVGVFAMAGGGKTTLLGMLARHAESDVNVIALIGERGREVREFIEDALGELGLQRSVLVISTSDRPAMERVRAAYVATAIAEGFRAEGKRVMFLMDSVTRFARALREIGLAVGEPAVRRGYPPSVFAELPKLFERTGNDENGSITAFYTVLMEDDDGSDPIAEETRSLLDGHIVLSRKLGQAGHYPAIDVLGSISRVFSRVADAAQREDASRLRGWLAKHAEIEFMLQLGEYKPGSDAQADAAIAQMPALKEFLTQDAEDMTPLDATLESMRRLAS